MWLFDRLYFYILAKIYAGFFRLCDMIDEAVGFPVAGSDRDAVCDDEKKSEDGGKENE